MTNMIRKLRSRAGVSMIMALVFLLFCSFVGGAVLVSASSNAYRVNQATEQQDFLTQRSIAMVISDQLQLNDEDSLTLEVIDTQEPDSADAEKAIRNVSFRVVTTLDATQFSALHRLMIEATARRYLLNTPSADNISNCNVTFSGMPGIDDITAKYSDGTLSSTPAFLFSPASPDKLEGSMTVAPSNATESFTFEPVTFHFSSGDGDELYDFFLWSEDASVGTSEDTTANKQIMITINAFYGVNAAGNQTTIRWYDPLIENGGDYT